VADLQRAAAISIKSIDQSINKSEFCVPLLKIGRITNKQNQNKVKTTLEKIQIHCVKYDRFSIFYRMLSNKVTLKMPPSLIPCNIK